MGEEGPIPAEATEFKVPAPATEGGGGVNTPEPSGEFKEPLKRITTRDLYEVLGVGRHATEEEIQKAYRWLARKNHPDVNPGDPIAEENIKLINQANDVLSDPEKRSRYDRGAGIGTSGESQNPSKVRVPNVTAPAQPDRAEEFWNGVFGGFVNGGTAGTRSDSGRQLEREPKVSEQEQSRSEVKIMKRLDGTYYLGSTVNGLSLERNNLNRHAEIKQMAGLFVGKNSVGYYPINASGEPIGLFAWERVATDKDGRFLVLRDPRNFNGGERIDGQNVGVFNRPDSKKGTKGEVKVFAEYLENDTGLKMARTGKYFVLLGKHTGQTLNELADEYTEISFGTIKETGQPSSTVWGRKNQTSPWEVIVANYNQT